MRIELSLGDLPVRQGLLKIGNVFVDIMNILVVFLAQVFRTEWPRALIEIAFTGLIKIFFDIRDLWPGRRQQSDLRDTCYRTQQ